MSQAQLRQKSTRSFDVVEKRRKKVLQSWSENSIMWLFKFVLPGYVAKFSYILFYLLAEQQLEGYDLRHPSRFLHCFNS